MIKQKNLTNLRPITQPKQSIARNARNKINYYFRITPIINLVTIIICYKITYFFCGY